MSSNDITVTHDERSSDQSRNQTVLRKYKKGGSAGSKGVDFQVGLLTISLLNAFSNLKDWRLSTENDNAGKFDDLVLEWPEGDMLVQAKQIEDRKRKITIKQLMSTSSSDFSLSKYFESYVNDIKGNFKMGNVVICTNADIHENVKPMLEPVTDCCRSILYYPNANCSFYYFKDIIFETLKKSIIEYYKSKQSQNECVISDVNINEFINKLQICCNYPSGDNMKKIVRQLLLKTKYFRHPCGTVSSTDIFEKVKNWFQQKGNVYYLNVILTRAMFFDIWRDKYFHILENYDIAFNLDAINFQLPKGVSHLVTKNTHLSLELIIWSKFRNEQNSILCIQPNAKIEIHVEMLQVFKLLHYTYLIIISPEIVVTPAVQEIYCSLNKFIKESRDKRIILLADIENKLSEHIVSKNKVVIDHPLTLSQISPYSQTLLRSKLVTLQGHQFTLEDVFSPLPFENYTEYFDSQVLDMLIKEENIEVGSEVSGLDEELSACYINRQLDRNGEIYSEDRICEINEKVILVADGAGMGKTTILKNLALNIKKNYPLKWVITIPLSEYSKEFKSLLARKEEVVDIFKLLNSKYNFNKLEKLIFSITTKIVLMLDGVDEISPDYTDIVLNLLKECKSSQNIEKMFITTRSHMSTDLKDALGDTIFTLKSFTEEDMVEFLCRYWCHTLKLSDNRKDRCTKYARELMRKMELWMNTYSSRSFGTIPLQLRMAADLFKDINEFDISQNWQGCKQFLDSDNEVPKLFELNIAKLYEMFVAKKRDIFVSKANPQGIPAAYESLHKQFEECLASHINLAVEVMFGEVNCSCFTSYRQLSKYSGENLLKIGIVQEIHKQIHFTHRTFAEYFAAKCLVMELQQPNSNIAFQKLFIDDVLRENRYDVVRCFVDSILGSLNNSCLPGNIFKEYQKSVFSESSINTRLIHSLASEGHINILGLLLRAMNFRVNTGSRDFTSIHATVPIYIPCNTLSYLNYYLNMAGFNIEDENGSTPLHYASNRGHTRMVEFLTERGINLKIKDLSDQTALWAAVDSECEDIVKYFLQKSLELDGLSSENQVAAYAAAYLGNTQILKMMVEKGLDVNQIMEGEYLIFAASRGRQAETIKYLVQEGADVNSKDHNYGTALFLISMIQSRYGSFNCIAKTLIKLGADVNMRCWDQQTPIFPAADSENLDVLQVLLENGANVNCQDEDGQTALHLSRNVDGARYLVKMGADVNIKDNSGYSPLHAAVLDSWLTEGHSSNIVKFLILECGVDANVQDEKGYTPLHLAIKGCYFSIVKFLIQEGGSDLNIQTTEGQTPLELAQSQKKGNIFEFINSQVKTNYSENVQK